MTSLATSFVGYVYAAIWNSELLISPTTNELRKIPTICRSTVTASVKINPRKSGYRVLILLLVEYMHILTPYFVLMCSD